MTNQEFFEIVACFDRSTAQTMKLSTQEFTIELTRGGASAPAASAPAAAPAAAAAPVAKPVLAAAAPGTAGEVKLFDVADKEAAMLMAIVANKLGKPLNELRFKSIKEVK